MVVAKSKHYPSISLEELRKTEKKLRMANSNLQYLNEGHFADEIFREVKIFLVVFWVMTLEELAVSIFKVKLKFHRIVFNSRYIPDCMVS